MPRSDDPLFGQGKLLFMCKTKAGKFIVGGYCEVSYIFFA
jgi:hypothetical protein